MSSTTKQKGENNMADLKITESKEIEDRVTDKYIAIDYTRSGYVDSKYIYNSIHDIYFEIAACEDEETARRVKHDLETKGSSETDRGWSKTEYRKATESEVHDWGRETDEMLKNLLGYNPFSPVKEVKSEKDKEEKKAKAISFAEKVKKN